MLDLADKLDDLTGPGSPAAGDATGADDAMRALVSLGYSAPDAETAVRAVLDTPGLSGDVPALIRAALAAVSSDDPARRAGGKRGH